MRERNYASGTIWTGDCLDVMRGMDSGTVDLIYLDPPFNSNADYAAPIGSAAAGAAFRDTWTLSDVDVEWINLIEQKHPALYRVLLAAMRDSDKAYLAYMAARLLEMPRLLAPTGSIYLHCDPTMSHYLKLVMDAIFGRRQFRNEIVWCYGGRGMATRWFNRKHDVLLFYAKTGAHHFDAVGAARPVAPEHVGRYNKTDAGGRKYARIRNRDGTYSDVYLKDVVREDWWEIPYVRGKEHVGYPTQKPLTLLDRIVRASCPPGGMVLDPFCGCATTLVAADRLDREWAGIDLSPKAAELVVRRVEADQGLWRNIVHRTDVPRRTDLGDLPRYNCAANRQTLYGQQGGHCAGCATHFEPRHLEVDHIIARAKGGTDHLGNLQLLCGSCNRIKGDRGMEYLAAKLQLRAA
ncbi:MAG: DNA methyltransferase [Chloroflexi bacterium]|nr:DNA methyltransferase [Chloroflexota bacterium]